MLPDSPFWPRTYYTIFSSSSFQVLGRDVIFGDLACSDLRGVFAFFNPFHGIGLERVTLFGEFFNALGISASGVGHSLDVTRLTGRIRAKFVVAISASLVSQDSLRAFRCETGGQRPSTNESRLQLSRCAIYEVHGYGAFA